MSCVTGDIFRRLRPLALFAAMVLMSAATSSASVYLFPDEELLSSDFQTEPWGSGHLVGKEDLVEGGVQITLRLGLHADEGKTVVGDDWPVAAAAGLGWDGGYLPNDPSEPHAQPHSNVSINQWKRMALPVRYVAGGGPIRIKLFMNTGLTGPSGYPENDWRNNTAWVSAQVHLEVGESATVVLDFDNAQVWGASDNPAPHSGHDLGWADGTQHAINERDRHEVTNVGFETYGPAEQTIVLELNPPLPPPELRLLAPDDPVAYPLSFEARDARDYGIEWSADLEVWSPLRIVRAVVGKVEIADPGFGETETRFYRAVPE
jgi:hypothetical protein